jgi:hypothetical protein
MAHLREQATLPWKQERELTGAATSDFTFQHFDPSS